MRNRFTLFAAFGLLLLFFSACSTQKNTWGSRHFHEMTTRYNIYFNGNQAYKQGLAQLRNNHKEDYSKFLPMYLVSDHEKAKATASNMNRTIEKCQKAIKKHSIRIKPEKKPNSKSSEAKKRFYSQEEFNPYMDNVFLLMANAQFCQADFLSTSATCSYIQRHFSTDKLTCEKAGLLLARAYTELDWGYEAENQLDKLNKESLSPSLTGEFSAAYADLLIRRKKYAEAIPYLSIAVKKVKTKREKQRWTYLLAQLYQEVGRSNEAFKLFSSIPGMNPSYEMELSARIRQTEVYPGDNPQKPLRKLKKLSRSSKNTNYLDQVYYALGNLYFAAKDTVKGVESFITALEKSTQNGPHKLKTDLALGSYYYNTQQFLKAEPCYTEAISILNKEDERYQKVFERSELLNALAPPLQTIHDEDSLQTIARMPENERNEIISKLIAAAEKAAKEEAKKKAMEEALSANEQQLEENETTPNQQPNLNTLSISLDKSWYFYNPNTVSKGLNDFRKKWGKRSLKDDWRRNNKTAIFENMQESGGHTASNPVAGDSLGSAMTDTTANLTEDADNPLKPTFYLKNLPFTEEQITESNAKIAEALYQSGLIFREQMENDKLALNSFENLETRFPKSPFLENAYYITYLILKQQKRDAEAETVRKKQLELFPEGQYANRLDDSLFIEKLKIMYQVQDTLYARTYQAYLKHVTDSIFDQGKYVEENYPVSPLIPKFRFLQAMESARTGKPDDFHQILISITKNYPKSDLIPVINQMLAYWDEGRRPVPSAGFTNLLQTNPGQQTEELARIDSLAKQFKFDPAEPHFLLISYPAQTTNINRLQFDVALYNFTNFLIRDYELTFSKVGSLDVLLISGFESAEDVMRYRSWINFQNEKPEEKYPGLRFIVVSDSNLKLLQEGVPVNKYLDFFQNNYSDIKLNP